MIGREVPPGGEVSGVSLLLAQFAADRQQLVPLRSVVQRRQPEVDYHLKCFVLIAMELFKCSSKAQEVSKFVL